MQSSSSKAVWLIPLLTGLVFILFGAIILKKPMESFYAMSLIIGISLIVSGALEIFIFSKHRQYVHNWSWFLSGGFIDVLLGLILILNPKVILIGITILISVWLFYRAFLTIKKSMELKQQKNKNWIWGIVFGALILGLGVLLIKKPQIIGKALAFWIAIAFVLIGVYRVYLSFQVRKLLK